MIEIPGLMSRGNWTAALFVDDKASIHAMKALTRIFTGRVGGSTHLLSILVGSFLGVRQVPISYEPQGETRLITIDKIVDGAITPVARQGQGRERRHPQQRILDRARCDRRAGRQVALPRFRPQLEFRPADRLKSASSTGATGSSRSCTDGATAYGQARERRAVRPVPGPCLHRLRRGAARCWRCWRPPTARLGHDVRAGSASRCSSTASTARWRGGFEVGGDPAALVRRCARSRGRFHHLRVRAGLCACAPAACCRRSLAIPLGVAIVVTGALYFADGEMKTAGQLFPRLSGAVERGGLPSVRAEAAAMDRGRRRRRASWC